MVTVGTLVINCEILIVLSEPGGAFPATASIQGNEFGITSNALEVAFFCSTPKTIVQVDRFAARRCRLSRSEARTLVEQLQASQILVQADSVHENLWFKYNWIEAFHLLRNSRIERFAEADANAPSDIRADTLRSYLKTDGAVRNSNGTTACAANPLSPSVSVPPASAASLPTVGYLDAWSNRRTSRSLRSASVAFDLCAAVLQNGTLRAQQRRKCETYQSEDPLGLLDSLFAAFEFYLIACNVIDLKPGVYHFDLRTSVLDPLRAGDFEDHLHSAVIGQRMAVNTAFAIVITAVFDRYQWRYRSARGYCNLLISAGEAMNLLLLAGSLHGLRQWMTPAMRDSQMDALLGVDSREEQALYTAGFGL